MGNSVLFLTYFLPFWSLWGNNPVEAVTTGGHGNRVIDIQSESHKLNETVVFIALPPHL